MATVNGSLTERYRPRTLSDLVGQGETVLQLRAFLEDPVPSAFIFSGPTGVGKTSAALAFARELGCDPDSIVGGVEEIPSGDQTADKIRQLLRDMAIRPMLGNGWKVVILNEGDRMSEAVQHLWLDALESLPGHVIVIFTTNHPEKMSKRLRDRCEPFAFEADAVTIRADVQRHVNEVWHRETGRTDAPRIEDIPGTIDGTDLSIRAAVQGLNPMIRKAKLAAPKPAPVAVASVPTPAPVVRHADPVVAIERPAETCRRPEPALYRSLIELQTQVDAVWLARTGRIGSPLLTEIPGAIRDGKLSVRAAMSGLDELIRATVRASPRPLAMVG